MKALLIKDLVSLMLYALFSPLITALKPDDADQTVIAIDAPSNPTYWVFIISTTVKSTSIKTLLGKMALSPSNISAESNLINPITVIKNINNGKNDNIK